MNDNKDNNRLEIPSSGMIVRENYELVQLMDCCMYVLPSNNNLSEELVQKNFDKLLFSSKTLLNHYDVDFLEELPCMDNHPNLSSALALGRYNLIMGMNEPGFASGKQYLLLQSSDSSIDADMAAMLKVSEQITSESVKRLMLCHAMNSHESFIRSTEHIWESDEFWENFIARRFGVFFGCGVICMAFGFRGGRNLDEVLTHRKRLELQNKFIDNVQKLNKEQLDLNVRNEAKKEVKIVLDCLNLRNQDMISYLKMIPEGFVEQFCNKIIPKKIAEQSDMQIEVRWVGKIDVKKPSNGNIRLFLHKGNKEQQVLFNRKPAFALYLLYLIDVYKSESVDTLNIKDCEKEFCYLYDKSYYLGGAESFNTMIGKGSSEQELLRHQLKEIRMAVGNACEIIGEAASPYVLNDVNSHLYILKKNVIIDKQLEPLVAAL